MDNLDIPDFLESYKIRQSEDSLLRLFSEGKLFGTTHTSIGQELIAVSINKYLEKDDIIFSNHRCHGHYIAKTDDIEGLFFEIMGKKNGMCSGKGGSQHICGENFFSNGIQGGIVPISAGVAFANKITKKKNIAVVFIGDGTLGQGVLYETLNIISKWEIPLLIVLENNRIAQSTKQEQTLAGSIKERFLAFGVKSEVGSIWETSSLFTAAENAITYVRNNKRPFFLQIDAYRLRAHSKGDDDRDINEISKFEEIDPINIFFKDYSVDLKNEIEAIDLRISKAIKKALKGGYSNLNIKKENKFKDLSLNPILFDEPTQLVAINKVLDIMLNKFKTTMIIGEDIESPYGGAFKATAGLSKKYPGRVINTPISESAIVGIGCGLAMTGMKPIIEIMFGDFITLAFDQIVNHATKFNDMYDGKVEVPLIIRTPMGAGRGYGATHSQSLEKFFAGVPGLNLIVLHSRSRIFNLYNSIYENIDKPTLIIENKILYSKKIQLEIPENFDIYETLEFAPSTLIKSKQDADLTIIGIGGVSSIVEEVVYDLFKKEEINSDIIFPQMLSNINYSLIINSIKLTKKLLIVEEGTEEFNFSSQIISDISMELKGNLNVVFSQVATPKISIPSSKVLEEQVIPSKEIIIKKCLELFYE